MHPLVTGLAYFLPSHTAFLLNIPIVPLLNSFHFLSTLLGNIFHGQKVIFVAQLLLKNLKIKICVCRHHSRVKPLLAIPAPDIGAPDLSLFLIQLSKAPEKPEEDSSNAEALDTCVESQDPGCNLSQPQNIAIICK